MISIYQIKNMVFEQILLKYCPPTVEKLHCLEISSGSGQHVIHFGMHMPHVEFQPSDCDPASLNRY